MPLSWNSLAATSIASAMSLPSLKPAAFDGLGDQVERGAVALQVGGEAALVAETGGQALLLQHRLEGVVDLGALLQRLAEGRGADRGDHELLDVDVGVGVRAAVDDVHHRHRQQVGVGAADVAEQRQAGRLGGGLGGGERDAEDRVGAELGLVGRAVEVEHRLVDEALVVGVEADDRAGDRVDDAADGLLHALAEVALAAVAQLDRLEGAGGGAAGHGRAAERAVLEEHLHLDGGVAARIEDLAGADCSDDRHGCAPEGGRLWDGSQPSHVGRRRRRGVRGLRLACAGCTRPRTCRPPQRRTSTARVADDADRRPGDSGGLAMAGESPARFRDRLVLERAAWLGPGDRPHRSRTSPPSAASVATTSSSAPSAASSARYRPSGVPSPRPGRSTPRARCTSTHPTGSGCRPGRRTTRRPRSPRPTSTRSHRARRSPTSTTREVDGDHRCEPTILMTSGAARRLLRLLAPSPPSRRPSRRSTGASPRRCRSRPRRRRRAGCAAPSWR